jgi:hypothetical protein
LRGVGIGRAVGVGVEGLKGELLLSDDLKGALTSFVELAVGELQQAFATVSEIIIRER